jgi:predicted small lipoprotein YifL
MMLKTTHILLVLLALTACGTKGPLYIPEQRYPEGVPKDQGVPKEIDTKDINKGVENDATEKDALQVSIHAASTVSS